MTTFTYNLTLDDNEVSVVGVALKQLIRHCNEKLKDGPVSPYWAQKVSAEKVLSMLYEDTSQTSGNDFDSSGNTIWIKQ